MSPILNLQERLRELGRLRMGEKGAKNQPVKLAEWRLTSANRDLLELAATLYGGTVAEWEGAPTQGTQYELKTGTDRLDVRLPSHDALSQWLEAWSGGGCQRRCDGRTNVLLAEPCTCSTEVSEGRAQGPVCKPTSRLDVILPKLPDLGVWRLETEGYHAATELAGTLRYIRRLLSAREAHVLPLQLRIDQRTAKKDGRTNHFVVPVLELPAVTYDQLTAGLLPQELPEAETSPALEPPADPADRETGEVRQTNGHAPPPEGKVNPYAKAIHLEAQRIGLSDDDLADLLRGAIGNPSANAVNRANKDTVLAAIGIYASDTGTPPEPAPQTFAEPVTAEGRPACYEVGCDRPAVDYDSFCTEHVPAESEPF